MPFEIIRPGEPDAPDEPVIDYTGPTIVPHVEVIDPNHQPVIPKGEATKYAFIRSGRTIAAALIAAVFLAITETVTSLTPIGVPGDLNSETFATFFILTFLGAGLNGAGKFLRDRGILTNPPV